MSFLYPAFLIGALAVAVPVLLHLLRNEQAPELPFSAVRLLRDVKVEQSQRRRIRDWLLLALRGAALLLLALAFARPYLGSRQVDGGAVTVIVIDRSASMGLRGAWQKAQEAALAHVNRTPAREALALVAFDDRAEVVVEPTFDRGAVRTAIDGLRVGIGGTRYQPAVARAVSLLDEADAPTGRIVLVSDLQGTAAEARVTVPSSIQVEAVPVSARTDNIAVLAARRTADGVIATLKNDGPSAVRSRVRLDLEGRMLTETPVDLPPGQPIDLPLRGAAPRGAVRVSLADPDPGGLTVDDSRYVDPGTGPRIRILVVSAPEDRFYLEAALRADDGSGFDLASATVQGLMRSLTQQPPPDMVFLVGPRGLDRGARDSLVRYVRSGGKLFVGASDALNEPGFAPILEGLTVSVPHADDPVLTLAAIETRHPVFSRLGPVSDAMGAARFVRAWRVRGTGWDVLARFSDGAPALLERSLGGGRVLFFASDVNKGWNDLPLQSSFVPFVHEIVRYLGPVRSASEFTPATLPDGIKPSLGLVRLKSGQSVVVNADPRESDSTRMTAAQFSSAVRRGGDRRMDSRAARRRAQAAEEHQSLWRYGLMLMFGTLVAEGVLGGSPRRSLGERAGLFRRSLGESERPT